MPALHRPTARVAHCAIAGLAWLCVSARAEWLEQVTDGVMGTRIRVELWAEERAAGEAAIEAVLAEMRRIDLAMSTYKAASEVSRVNDLAARQPVKISAELYGLLETSLDYSRLTEGAFDITYASVGYLYDFKRRVHPDERQIEAALPGIDYRNVQLDPKARTVRFARTAVRIDLGGIGKGHAVDRGIEVLRQRGFERALVTAGGDSRIIGDRFGKPWVIGIRHPDRKDQIIARIPLEDAAISTSGDYERYFDVDGERYHHIINPRTGHSASKVRSATLIGPSATRTDGLSKTAFVLGAQRALEIYNRIEGIDAVLVTPAGEVLYTQGLEPPPAAGRH
jgi:thiamine biosynthesis lipoprotein